MTNGRNDWNVPYSHITWFDRLLRTHDNIANVQRSHDILFEVDRKKQNDHLKILCCREYTMGLTSIQRGLYEFGPLNIFYIGGGWCGYTRQAKEFCVTQKIGLFISEEMNGGLWKNDYWTYHRRDKDGNPVYSYTTR
jgi:hypothetical protein